MPERSRKMLAVSILEALQKETDAEHRISLGQLNEKLGRYHGKQVDYHTLRDHLRELLLNDYPVRVGDMEPEELANLEDLDGIRLKNLWYAHPLTDVEIHLLMDGLLFSRHIPVDDKKEIARKLSALSSIYFKNYVKAIQPDEGRVTLNDQLFRNFEILDDAISHGKQVAFYYNSYGTDGKLHPRQKDGKDRVYHVSPYKVAAVNGYYYLIANTDGHNDLSNYRIDRMTELSVQEASARKRETVENGKELSDLPRYIKEHIYMYPGRSVDITLRVSRERISDVLDWFQEGIQIFPVQGSTDEVDIHITANMENVRRWALQYATIVKVISPPDLRKQVKEDLEKALQAYMDENPIEHGRR